MQRTGGVPQRERAFGRPRVKQFYVAGIFETALTDFDELYALTDLRVARGLFDYDGSRLT